MIYNYILYGNRVVGLLWPYYCGRTVFIFAKQELLDKSRSIGVSRLWYWCYSVCVRSFWNGSCKGWIWFPNYVLNCQLLKASAWVIILLQGHYMFLGNLIHLLTAPKRHICAAWDLPRKSKNLRPCAVHFGVLHKVFFSSYFVLANHSVTPAFLPFGTRADPEKISIFLWANPNFPPSYYSFNAKKRAVYPRIFLFEIPTGKG